MSNVAGGDNNKLSSAAEYCTTDRLTAILETAAAHPNSITSIHLRLLVYALLWERKKNAELADQIRNKSVLASRGHGEDNKSVDL